MSKEVTGEMERVLKIPGDVMEALRLPPDEVETELRKELALYQRGVLSFRQSMCPCWDDSLGV
jgi:hypothetical protein